MADENETTLLIRRMSTLELSEPIRFGQEEKDIVTSEDGIKTVIQALKKDMTNANTAQHLVRILHMISKVNATACKIVIEGSGIPLLLQAIRSNISNQGLVLESLGALLSMSTCDGAGRVDMVDNGGIDVICDVFTHHTQHISIQENCTKLLLNIFESGNNKASLTKGLISTFLGRLQHHATPVPIIEICLQFLRKVADIDRLQHLVGAKGTIQWVLDALQRGQNQDTQDRLLVFLVEVLYGNESNQRQLVASNGLDVIVDVLTKACTNGPIPASCMRILTCIVSDSGAAQEQLISNSGISKVVTAMDRDLHHPGLQSEYSGFLTCLTMNEKHFDLIGQCLLPVLIRSMKVHVNDESIQTRQAFILANLTTLPINQIRLLQGGGIPVLIECLGLHKHDLDLQLQYCKALTNLASSNDDIRQEIIVEGGVKAICDVMQTHTDNTELQQRCCALLVHVGEDVDLELFI